MSSHLGKAYELAGRDYLTDADHEALRELRFRRDEEAWSQDFSATSTKKRSQANRLTLPISDLHFPNEDPQTWRIYLRAIIDLDPDDVLLLGDVMDLEPCTSHRPTGATAVFDVEDECAYTRRRLRQVNEALMRADRKYRKGKPKRGRRCIYMMGNHEARFARSKGGVDPVWRRTIDALPAMLELDDLGWEWAEIPLDTDWRTGKKRKNTQPIKNGELFLHHGESFSVNHARAQTLKRAVSQLYGHTHRAQQVYTTFPDPETGGTRVVHVTGLPCGCRLFAPWTAQPGMSDWVNGFGVIEHVAEFRFVYNVVLRHDRDGIAHAAYGRWRWSAEVAS